MEARSQNDKLLKKLYFEILDGHTPAEIRGEKVWIKHFTTFDQAAVDEVYTVVKEEAEEKGLPPEAELVKNLVEEGHWTTEEQDLLERSTRMKKALLGQKSKAVNSQMLKMIENDIETHRKKEQELTRKKKSLLHDTSEDFASKRTNDVVVKTSFYKNKEGERYYSDEDFDYLERKEIYELIAIYNDATEHLSIDNIKEVAAQDFFTTYYSLVDKAPYKFFDKPVYELTFFQVNLINYAQLITRILQNYEIPEHLRNDAKGLIAFAESENKKRKKASAAGKGGKGRPSTF